MNIYYLTSIFSFIHISMGFIEITGELTFDVLPINENGDNNARAIDNKRAIGLKIQRNRDWDTSDKTTAAIREEINTERINVNLNKKECLYQYPDKKQVEALLSDMMNQLTKIFVGAFEYIGEHDQRPNDKRFKIINKKFNSSFFEQAFDLMSKQYRHSINTTANEAKFSNRDPCNHQSDIKQMWQNLLDHSKYILKGAAMRCINDLLRVRNRADDTRTKKKLSQLLLREIREVRSNQLKVLCDDFKLCYKDLL